MTHPVAVSPPPLNDFTTSELRRYSRHLILPEVGLGGQRQLKASRVLLVGVGGLGSPAALYLAAAGAGTLGLVDFDAVDLTNLQRQVLHGTADVGRPKLDSATDRIREVNPHVHVERFDVALTAANALEIAKDFDLIVDGTDNFPTRYLVNQVSVFLQKPNVYGSIFRFEGQASVFAHANGPCYQCLYREPPPSGLVPNCAEGGVLGVLPGIVGSVQAAEAIKLLLGLGQPLVGTLLFIDTLRMRFRSLRVRKDPSCPLCGTREIRELIDYGVGCGTGREAGIPAGRGTVREISAFEVSQRLREPEPVQLIDVREPFEWSIGAIPGARHLPLATLPDAIGTLDPVRETIVYCKGGTRSRQAAALLVERGFREVGNLTGGILAWWREVEGEDARY